MRTLKHLAFCLATLLVAIKKTMNPKQLQKKVTLQSLQ